MHSNWLDWVPYAELAATLVLTARLLYSRLQAVYRYLFLYLAADAAETLAGLLFQGNRTRYAEVYFGGQTIKMGLAVFVVLEIYRIALADQPALARFGKNTVGYVLAGAAAIAASGFWLDRDGAGRDLAVRHFATLERTMDAWMLLFLLAISAFMLWFPVRLTRNSYIYIAGFVVYFLARSLGLLLSNAAPRWISKLDDVMIGVQTICLIAWIFGLRPAGERITTVIGHAWDPARAGRLQEQLNAINAALARMSRR